MIKQLRIVNMTSHQTFAVYSVEKATVNKTLILDTHSIIQHLILINFTSLTALDVYQQNSLVKCLPWLFLMNSNISPNHGYLLCKRLRFFGSKLIISCNKTWKHSFKWKVQNVNQERFAELTRLLYLLYESLRGNYVLFT